VNDRIIVREEISCWINLILVQDYRLCLLENILSLPKNYIMRLSLFLLLFVSFNIAAQDTTTISLVFMGDIMGHDSQINSARIGNSERFDYHSCFKYIKHDIQSADIAIGNLEVTLAGKPHKGYPTFSSPDTLADALKDAGVDALIMANNHCVDRRKQGLERTLKVLDEKGIPRTGVFKDSLDRVKHNPMIVEAKGIRLAVLNYTYGTNGIRVQHPNIVNQIDTGLMARDIEMARSKKVDELIVCMHWGWEYHTKPNPEQKRLTQFLWNKGVKIIIGSHPHVVQPMELHRNAAGNHMVAYSMGNFISNQRPAPRDGSALAFVELTKLGDSTFVSNAEYQLTWVYTPVRNGKKRFYVLPAERYKKATWMDATARTRMNAYLGEAREIFKSNKNVSERRFILPPHKLKAKGLVSVTVEPGTTPKD